MKLTSLTLALAIGLSACSTASAGPSHHAHYKSASPGHWKLNPRKCPDLVEDWHDRRESRIDEAYDHNRRDVIEDIHDRRESRQDEAHTQCPASAWEWRGPKYKAHYHAPRPVKVKVFYNPHKKHYYHRHGKKRIVVNW